MSSNPTIPELNIKDKFIRIIKQYRKAFIILSIIIGVLIVGYFLSDDFNINRTVNRMKIYNKYLVITSKLNTPKMKQMRLCDFYIASSFRSCFSSDQGYSSVRILKSTIRAGSRFLWFDIFNDTLNEYTTPVVSHGVEKGDWKLTANTITFDSCCKMISETAFSPKEVNNYNDPLIIALNLNVNNNKYTLKKIQESILRYLGSTLLDANYAYQTTNIGQVRISELLGKVIIFSSSGYLNSTLEELINYSWDKQELKLLDYRTLDPDVSDPEYPKIDLEDLENYNTNNLSIVTPDINSFTSNNYNFKNAWKSGCQFIAMNYSLLDDHMDDYITNFKNNSFIPKPVQKRLSTYGDDELTLKQNNMKKFKQKVASKNCPIKPTDDSNLVDISALDMDTPIYFKDDKQQMGGCVFDTKCPKNNWKNMKKNLSLVINEANKNDNHFNYGSANLGAGNDTEGNQYLNWNPKICCSSKKENKIDKMYVLSPNCLNPDSFKGQVGLKVHQKDAHKVPFDMGSRIGNYRWTHPKLCQVKNNIEAKKGKYCLLSTNTCPEDWKNSDDKDIELENNWKLCCRNLD